MKRSDFIKSGSEGGKIAASRMTPKQRSERARKAGKARKAGQIAEYVARIKDGRLDLVRARLIAQFQRHTVELLKLTARAHASGSDDPFFVGPVVTKEQIEDAETALRQLRNAIKGVRK
jgi:hypothetical protein